MYVSSTPSFFNAPAYIILSANKLQTDTMGQCYYERE
jgi:hypothetical protein